jgi:hypothetical protein
MPARDPSTRRSASRSRSFRRPTAGSAAGSPSRGTILGSSLDRYPDTYGIPAPESCRARHCILFRQRQRRAVRVGRRGKPDTDELGPSNCDLYGAVPAGPALGASWADATSACPAGTGRERGVRGPIRSNAPRQRRRGSARVGMHTREALTRGPYLAAGTAPSHWRTRPAVAPGRRDSDGLAQVVLDPVLRGAARTAREGRRQADADPGAAALSLARCRLRSFRRYGARQWHYFRSDRQHEDLVSTRTRFGAGRNAASFARCTCPAGSGGSALRTSRPSEPRCSATSRRSLRRSFQQSLWRTSTAREAIGRRTSHP